jgi:hypothetical protein
MATPTLIHGTVARNGTVVLTWNVQETTLRAPSGGVYFPCDACGVVHDVPQDVVAFRCDACAAHVEACDEIECDHPAHTKGEGMSQYERQERAGDAY